MVLDGLDDVGDGRVTAPTRVAPAGGRVRGIAVHGGDVYWVQGDASTGIVRASKDGLGQPSFFHATFAAFDVAVDDSFVYWSTGSGNQVFRKAIGAPASPAEVLFSGAAETLYLTVGASGRVYVTGNNTVAVGPRIDAGFGDVHYLFQPGAAGIALSDNDLFWSVIDGIVRGDVTGQPPRPVYNGAPGEVSGVATDGQEIYWITSEGTVRAMSLTHPIPVPRDLCRARIEATDAEVDARADSGGKGANFDIAVDDQWVYFAESAPHQISKCPK
jgi:hypothetical protein